MSALFSIKPQSATRLLLCIKSAVIACVTVEINSPRKSWIRSVIARSMVIIARESRRESEFDVLSKLCKVGGNWKTSWNRAVYKSPMYSRELARGKWGRKSFFFLHHEHELLLRTAWSRFWGFFSFLDLACGYVDASPCCRRDQTLIRGLRRARWRGVRVNGLEAWSIWNSHFLGACVFFFSCEISECYLQTSTLSLFVKWRAAQTLNILFISNWLRAVNHFWGKSVAFEVSIGLESYCMIRIDIYNKYGQVLLVPCTFRILSINIS